MFIPVQRSFPRGTTERASLRMHRTGLRASRLGEGSHEPRAAAWGAEEDRGHGGGGPDGRPTQPAVCKMGVRSLSVDVGPFLCVLFHPVQSSHKRQVTKYNSHPSS